MNPPKTNPEAPEKSQGRKAAQGQESPWPNEGEGNKTADREYRKGTEAFVKSGRVDEQAQKAAEALDSDEGKELRQAEEKGRKGKPEPTSK
jgi:hypothetical protein